MESTRRSFDRSSVSGPGLKKARLTEEQPNPNPRSFQQRLTAAAASPASARYSDGNDSSRGGGAYQPQPLQQQHQELVNQYKTALAELTFNSKPIITNLTIIAGESLHAAKAIASTICANILEVPSEQKLPSLYLLDSIVKNIGRDYIKYFATRLHEVFCRAYRQVDPSILSSMKHLFGTWKGVFPPQTLQMIERELGFVSSVNGSSSGTAAVRPDSQSQRPSHGIHVNPKYLERQRLQQSSRVKGVANDVPITLPSSGEDVVRPDKSASTGRAWNIQRSHVEAFSESVLEKKSSSVYGDLEYGSDILRNPGLGVQRSSGRVSENKSWYGSDGGVSKTIPSQRSGLNIKYGLPGYSLSKSSNVDLHPPAMQTPASRSGTAMSASWKNCEEEEFMWDVQSGSSDQDVANFSKISRKDHGALDDLEKLDFESHLPKSHGLHEVGSSFDTEAFSDAPSSELKDQSIDGQHSSVPWRLQELQSADILARTTTTGKSERYSDSLIDLPISSRISHRPASPSFPARHTYQQLRISADQDFPQSRSLSQSDPRAPQFRENLLSSVEPSNKQKLHPGDLLPLSQPTQYPISQQRQSDKPSEPSAKAQKQQLQQVSRSGTSSTSDHSDKHVTESPEPSSTSSLLAAVMKSGILSSISTGSLSKQSQDVRKKPSQPNSRPPVSNGPQLTPSGPQVKESISISQLHETTSDNSNDSQQKDEMQVSPGLAPVQMSNSVEKASDPLSNLLSSLVAKGLISASKSETSSRATPEPPAPLQKQNSKATKPCSRSVSSLSTSSVSHSNALAAESLREPHAKSTALPQNIMSEKQNFIGLEFRSDVIRELHPPVISSLFDDFPHECDICHLRVRHKERLDKHLEWHACKSQVDDNRSVSRRWYTDLDDWVAGRTGMPLAVESSGSMDGVETLMEDGESLLPADEDQCICVLCGEVFEDFFSLERNKWMFKGAVRMAHPSRNHNEGSVDESAEGAMVHVKCLSGSAVDDSGHKGNVETERDE